MSPNKEGNKKIERLYKSKKGNWRLLCRLSRSHRDRCILPIFKKIKDMVVHVCIVLNVLFGYHIIVGNLGPITLVFVFYENISDLKFVLTGYILRSIGMIACI